MVWEHKGIVLAELVPPSLSLHLRILKNYDEYTAFWRGSSGEEWQQIGEEIVVEYQTPFEFGLFAGNCTEAGSGKCDFEFFDVLTREEMATRRMMAGCRIGVLLSEEWVVRNAAIYTWNYNLALVKASPLPCLCLTPALRSTPGTTTLPS